MVCINREFYNRKDSSIGRSTQCDKTLSDITPLASMQVLSALTFRPELVQGYLSAYVYSGGADRGWVGILSQPRL